MSEAIYSQANRIYLVEIISTNTCTVRSGGKNRIEISYIRDNTFKGGKNYIFHTG